MSEKILESQGLNACPSSPPPVRSRHVNGVSFSMNQGDVLGIVGESGSGKSVTAYSIMGLIRPIPGKPGGRHRAVQRPPDLDKMTEKEFRKIRGNEVSIIFQDPMTSLNPVFTIGNQIVEVILPAHREGQAARPRARADRTAGAGRHQRAGEAPEAVPPRAVRRYAPACHDRHGPGLRAEAC